MAIKFSVTLPTGPGARPVHLTRVSLRDVGPFSSLDFDVPRPRAADEGQWIVMLGANGTGKSTLLRSIALALEGDRSSYMYLSMLGRPFVRGAGNGTIAVSGPRAAHTIEIMRGPPDIPVNTDDAVHNVDVFGYGATRGTALGGSERDVTLGRHRVSATLFSSQDRLIHAETWLRREKLRASATEFGHLLERLSSLLPHGEMLELRRDQVWISDGTRGGAAFSTMSDGYLTTLGWTIDFVAQWSAKHTAKSTTTDDMPCIVLVDEIDLHLHPKWQLDIIPRLRNAFPKTTFVVTTHNPLTLQGTRPGEVFVLRKDDDTGEISIVQRDVLPGSDANRLLTGDWFGLGSTLDESTLTLLDEHRAMLLARRPENDPKRLALEARLRTRLNGFADTSYERMALDVIAQLHDEKMRQRQDITDEDRARVVREVRARLAALDAPATSAREPLPTFRPPTTKPKARTSKPSAEKKKPAARTKRR